MAYFYAILYHVFVDKLRSICYNQNDLWITYEEGEVDHRLDVFNWIASGFQLPYFASYTLSKWSNKSMQKNPRAYVTLQFFTFFPVIYITYNGSARKKSSRIFSCVRVRIRFNEFSHSNICLYTIAAALRKQTGQAWRLELAMDISCLWLMWTRLKSAQMARHGYDAIRAHNLFAVYHIDKFSTDSCTSFYDGKMCECT